MNNPAKEFDPINFLAKVGTGKTMLQFHKNQDVFKQGDVADTVFYIQKGKVKLTVMSEQGKEAVVAILEPGQFFGEGCLNGHALRIATTTAMEDSLITVITKAAMIAAIHDEPRFSELFMAYLLTRNSRIEEDLIDSAASPRQPQPMLKASGSAWDPTVSMLTSITIDMAGGIIRGDVISPSLRLAARLPRSREASHESPRRTCDCTASYLSLTLWKDHRAIIAQWLFHLLIIESSVTRRVVTCL